MKILISNSATVKAKITLSGSQECVDRVLAMLSILAYNGGSSGIYGINFDGDGADSINITGDIDHKRYADMRNELLGHGEEIVYVDEGLRGYRANTEGRIMAFPPPETEPE